MTWLHRAIRGAGKKPAKEAMGQVVPGISDVSGELDLIWGSCHDWRRAAGVREYGACGQACDSSAPGEPFSGAVSALVRPGLLAPSCRRGLAQARLG